MQHSLHPARLPAHTISLRLFVGFDYLLLGLVALALRVIDLGRFVTLDEANFWLQRSERFLAALRAGDWAATAIAPHPGVTTMWLGSAGLLLEELLVALGAGPLTFTGELRLMQLPVALFHIAGLLAGYALLQRMLPRATALLAAALWATDPFVVGFSRVLHVDALAGTAMTVAILAAIVYWRHDRRAGWLLLSGLAATIAALSKSPGLLAIPAVVAVALASPRVAGGNRVHDLLGPLCLWACAGLASALALWPALWASPLEVYQLVRFGVEGDGATPHALGNFFLGREDASPGALFYPVALALRLTPLSLAGLLLLPLALSTAGNIARRDIASLAGMALLFVAALALFPKKFNRYLTPIFPALDILAAIGLAAGIALLATWLWRARLVTRLGSRRLAAGLMSSTMLLALANAAAWHPYGIVAFNQLLGGAPAGSNAFVVGWGEGMEQVAEWLNQQPDITGVVVASTQTAPLRPYLVPGAQVAAPRHELPDQTGYVVVYHRDTQPRPLPPFDQFYGRAAPAHVVRIHGVEYAWIYEVPPPVPQPLSAQFGDALLLRGYAVERTAEGSGDLRLRLFWRTVAPPTTDYAIFAHLVGPNGRRYAQSDPVYPTAAWGDERYVTTELRLAMPREAAGEAQLVVGVYDPRDGRRLPLGSGQVADRTWAGPDALLVTALASLGFR